MSRLVKHSLFFPYVIQVGRNVDALYVNYATHVTKAFKKFLHKHSMIRDSVLRYDLFDKELSYRTVRLAERACHRLIHGLESEGFEVIAGGPLHNNFWKVYVIEIDGDPRHLYVGQTNYPVEKRYQQHVCKLNPARVLLRYDSFELAMQHAEHLPAYRTKGASLAAEAALAEELRALGFTVEGGH